ncbi:hypothetical protein FHS29_004476 [Saccharothrix tamanrassetensis]|uniref:Uncharacterized protein n=1 Tax=Saccharothrix tamanrassetensis TaxID=1051531 RepID=A0A841CK49_9PSEU|nr:hypothetical protein [Saccharothrix tamanrassetensis]MBB5957881.1 hypothetical protein [Saccharothrix tamanrassetensis]
MSSRLLLPTVLVLAALTGTAGVLAREVYQRPAQAVGDRIAVPSASSPVPRGSQPGSPTVQLSIDAALHPDGERVREALQSYFDAINAQDYDRWTRTVTAERVNRTPRVRWESDYESSRNGTVLVHRVEYVTPTRLRVLMTFVSTQDVAKAPADLQTDCISWRVVYPLQAEAGALRVDFGPEGSSSQSAAC